MRCSSNVGVLTRHIGAEHGASQPRWMIVQAPGPACRTNESIGLYPCGALLGAKPTPRAAWPSPVLLGSATLSSQHECNGRKDMIRSAAPVGSVHGMFVGSAARSTPCELVLEPALMKLIMRDTDDLPMRCVVPCRLHWHLDPHRANHEGGAGKRQSNGEAGVHTQYQKV